MPSRPRVPSASRFRPAIDIRGAAQAMTRVRVVVTVALAAVCGCDVSRDEPARAAGDTASAAAPAVEPAPAAPRAPDSDRVRSALESLLRGPSTTGRGGGAVSWFGEETAGSLRSVSVDSSGHAIVDFHDLRRLIPNASSSAGSAMLLDELNDAIFVFPEIRSVEYRMDGSCDLFWEWLQYGCHTVTRPGGAR